MTTLTIEISDEQARQLAEEASRESVAIQELVTRRLFSPLPPESEKADVRAIAREIIAENAELYRRLA